MVAIHERRNDITPESAGILGREDFLLEIGMDRTRARLVTKLCGGDIAWIHRMGRI
jgi:hypothetical protein